MEASETDQGVCDVRPASAIVLFDFKESWFDRVMILDKKYKLAAQAARTGADPGPQPARLPQKPRIVSKPAFFYSQSAAS